MQVGSKYSILIMSSIAKTGTLQRIISSFRRGILRFQSASLHLTSKHVPKRTIAAMLLPAMRMDDHKLVVPCFLPYENNRESSWSRPLSSRQNFPTICHSRYGESCWDTNDTETARLPSCSFLMPSSKPSSKVSAKPEGKLGCLLPQLTTIP
jgi:hypothetical protein